MRRMNALIGMLLSCSFVGPARADWASGGGGVLRDAGNPWFLQNTPMVRYCIDHDPEAFHLNADEGFPLPTLVAWALAHWQKDFREAANPLRDTSDGVAVATQRFEEVSCDVDVDLRFQFGKLTEEQRAGMREYRLDPRDYISVAVRTDYDRVHLRGKGFIYLAADRGPLRPDSEDLLPTPWSVGSGGLIYRVLVHELGHVFGVQHQSDLLSFMRAEYPDEVTSKITNASVNVGYSYQLPSFFSHLKPNGFSICMNLDLRPLAADFFGIPAGWDCVETRFHGEENFEIWAVPTPGAEPRLIGRAVFEPTLFGSVFELPISVWLPREQRVYAENPHRQGRTLYGSLRIQKDLKGSYQSVDGTINRPIWAKLTPLLGGWSQIGGVMDGTAYIDIENNR